MEFTETDERPVSSRPLTELEETIKDALTTSLSEGKTFKSPVDDMDEYETARKAVQKMAGRLRVGGRVRPSRDDNGTLHIVFWAVELTERLYVECPVCGKNVAVTEQKQVRTHGPRDSRCEGSGIDVEVTEG